MLLDSNGNYTGYIWQTAIMSDNFNRYGHYISTDALKWDINTFLWNYVAIALINEIGKLYLGAKGIICSERLQGYAQMIFFTLKHSFRKAKEIFVLSADKIANQKFLPKI